MEEWIGSLIKSAAGHDKGKIFFIIEEMGEYVYLVDGKYKTLECPKKKKKKHVEIFAPEGGSIGERLRKNQKVTDEEIKYFIRCFKREEQVV